MGTTTGAGVFMSGGRSRFGTGFNNDVWFSENGTTWTQMPKAPFGQRAYHAMWAMGECIFVAGGQTFTKFLNDVWKSCDGALTWQSLGNAPWAARAGLAFAVHRDQIIVGGGCHPGPGLPPNNRAFYNDVWSSPDGANWTQLTANASWSARSGPRIVSFKDKLLLVAGERGFTPDVQLGDVWSSDDGGAWSLVTNNPGFTPRSGHGVVVIGDKKDTLLLLAGWPELHDAYTSSDGASWSRVDNTTWNCAATKCGKFDFWSLVDPKSNGRRVLTFGGSNAYSTFGKLWSDTWEYVSL